MRTLMPLTSLPGQLQKYRVTLEFNVLEDFNPHDINYENVFNLEPAESVSVTVEDMNLDW
jgi:hypothetical protein